MKDSRGSESGIGWLCRIRDTACSPQDWLSQFGNGFFQPMELVYLPDLFWWRSGLRGVNPNPAHPTGLSLPPFPPLHPEPPSVSEVIGARLLFPHIPVFSTSFQSKSLQTDKGRSVPLKPFFFLWRELCKSGE